jgi:CRISPR-associated protein Cmr2
VYTVAPWVNAFCGRRELFKGNDVAQQTFVRDLSDWLKTMWQTTSNEKAGFETTRDREIQTWLKLAAFILRKRNIVVG